MRSWDVTVSIYFRVMCKAFIREFCSGNLDLEAGNIEIVPKTSRDGTSHLGFMVSLIHLTERAFGWESPEIVSYFVEDSHK